MKFSVKQLSLDIFQQSNNKIADQIAWIQRQACAFVVCMHQSYHYVFCQCNYQAICPFIFKNGFIDISIEEGLLREITM